MTKVLKNLKNDLVEDLEDWGSPLNSYLNSEKFDEILNFLIKEVQSNKIITPQKKNLFNAFKYCKYSDIKVIIVGDAPYSQFEGGVPVANGLAFSSNTSKFLPKDLENIFLEIESTVYGGFDLEFISRDLDLTSWAKQGVLLLNTSLSTRKDVPGSHLNKWDSFIEEVFKVLREKNTGLIYCLWGKKAKSYEKYIDKKLNYILVSENSPTNQGRSPWCSNNSFIELNNIIERNNGKNFKINWKK